jgi:hypothetical protein
MLIIHEMPHDPMREYLFLRESEVSQAELTNALHHTPPEDEKWEQVYSLSMHPGEAGLVLQDIELTREEYVFLKHTLAASPGLGMSARDSRDTATNANTATEGQQRCEAIPAWVDHTPPDHMYAIDMTGREGEVQAIRFDRKEFIGLKKALASRRGILPRQGGA